MKLYRRAQEWNHALNQRHNHVMLALRWGAEVERKSAAGLTSSSSRMDRRMLGCFPIARK